MKIDTGSLPPDTPRVHSSQNKTQGHSTQRPGGASGASVDAVSVSSGAQIAAEAARQLADAVPGDEVRADVVARAKAAVANGEVGADLNRLADRLIDRMLDEIPDGTRHE